MTDRPDVFRGTRRPAHFAFKGGEARVTAIYSAGEALCVSYRIGPDKHTLALSPGDPRRDPHAFRQWLEAETKARGQERRQREIALRLERYAREDRESMGALA